MPSVTGPGESGPEALGGCETATSGTQNNNIEASDSDHVIARSNGGSDRASNLVPACVPCNQNQTAADIQAVLAKDQLINGSITINHGSSASLRRQNSLSRTPPPSMPPAGRSMVHCNRSVGRSRPAPADPPSGTATASSSPKQMPSTRSAWATWIPVIEIAGSKQSALHITAYGRGAPQRTRLTNKGF